MASRDLLPIIRAARAGDPGAQLTLGRHYLFGGGGLPRSPVSALHWLDRAARRDIAEAWQLIGEHISYETARHAASTTALLPWYEKAFDTGVLQAGLTFARLVMDDGTASSATREKAMRALDAAAQADIPEAQWLLAQRAGGGVASLGSSTARSPGKPSASPLEWAASAADAGILAARYALAERAWAAADYAAFLRWSLPLARELVRRSR